MEFLKTPAGVVLQILLIILALVINGRLIFNYLINKATRTNDKKLYWKLLNSIFADIFIGSNRGQLMKAIFQSDLGDLNKAGELFEAVNIAKLSMDEKQLFVQVASTVAINTKNKTLFSKIGEVIDNISDIAGTDATKSMKSEYDLIDKLYFHFEESVIGQLEDNISKSKDIPAKGMMQLMLAKAYHLSGDDKKTVSILMKAKEALAGSGYDKYISEAIKNTKILDN